MEFCRENLDVPNIQFQVATEMSAMYSYSASNCTVTNAITPPLDLTAGSHILLDLAYDLTNLVTYRGSQVSSNCDPTGYCFSIPTFVPTVTLQ